MAGQSTDQLGALAHKALMRAERGSSDLMFRALHLDIVHVRAQHRLRNRSRIDRIVLLTFY